MAKKATKTERQTKAKKPIVELKEEDLDEVQGGSRIGPTACNFQAKGTIDSIGR